MMNKVLIVSLFVVVVSIAALTNAGNVMFTGDIDTDVEFLNANNLTMKYIRLPQHPGGLINPEFNKQALYFSQLADTQEGREPYYPRGDLNRR